jgi:hypothetical protein
MKHGTRIETISCWPGVEPERGTIMRVTREMMPLPAGYHPVKFDIPPSNGILIHETRFRVIDNRA